MKFRFVSCRLILSGMLLLTALSNVYSQEGVTQLKLTIPEFFSRVVENNPSLKVSQQQIGIAQQNTILTKNSLLPTAQASVSAFYLGNVNIYTPDFQNSFKQEMPHFGNSFALEFSQLIWKGGQVRESIHLASLQEEIAQLQNLSSEQNIKLLTLGYYLDYCKLHNQKRVYQQNIQLAEKRLTNIKAMYSQEMITRNDLIRTELQVSNLNMALQIVDNNIQILNKQLVVALGLSEGTLIVPDENLTKSGISVANLDSYYQTAANSNPSVLLTKKSVSIYESAEAIARKNYYPALALFAGNTLMRPVTSSTPAMDMYYNTWNAGVALSYDLGALWKNDRVVKMRQLELLSSQAKSEEVEKMIEVAVKAAHIKYQEAISQNLVYQKNRELADENYRIMENKYNHQLAILLDVIDASNSKLDSELQYANSEINIVFAYYKLLKEVGSIQ